MIYFILTWFIINGSDPRLICVWSKGDALVLSECNLTIQSFFNIVFFVELILTYHLFQTCLLASVNLRMSGYIKDPSNVDIVESCVSHSTAEQCTRESILERDLTVVRNVGSHLQGKNIFTNTWWDTFLISRWKSVLHHSIYICLKSFRC